MMIYMSENRLVSKLVKRELELLAETKGIPYFELAQN